MHAPAFYIPNTQVLVFVWQKDGWEYVVKDGIETKGNYPAYSLDGKSLAFVGYEKVSGRPTIMKDGKQNGKYDFVASPAYSPDSKSLTFVARKDQNSMVLVKDGIESAKFAAISSAIYFSPDGNTFAFVAQKVDTRGAEKPNNAFVVAYRKKWTSRTTVTAANKPSVGTPNTDVYTKRAQSAVDTYVKKRLAASANTGTIIIELGILRERIDAKKSSNLSNSASKQIDALLKVMDTKIDELSR